MLSSSTVVGSGITFTIAPKTGAVEVKVVESASRKPSIAATKHGVIVSLPAAVAWKVIVPRRSLPKVPRGCR
jgi:hypothetical protein